MKYGIAVIVAAFALSGVATSVNAASQDNGNPEAASPANTQPTANEAQAQPALPVITMSVPQTGGSPTPGTEPNNEFSAQELLSGYERGVVEPGLEILRSQSQLEALLQKIYSGQVPPEAPQVDFSQHVLVYYSLGTKMHGNDKVYIRSGSLEQGTLHVYVEIAHSSGDCLSTSSITAPFVIAALPFPAREVRQAEYSISHKNYPCT